MLAANLESPDDHPEPRPDNAGPYLIAVGIGALGLMGTFDTAAHDRFSAPALSSVHLLLSNSLISPEKIFISRNSECEPIHMRFAVLQLFYVSAFNRGTTPTALALTEDFHLCLDGWRFVRSPFSWRKDRKG